MACPEGNLKAEFSSKALKQLDDVLLKIGDSLVDVSDAKNLLKNEVDAAANRDANILSQEEMVPELTNHLKAFLVPVVIKQVKLHIKGILALRETFTMCDNPASLKVALASLDQLQLTLGAASTSSAPKTDVDVTEGSNRDRGTQTLKQSRRCTRRGRNICRHSCRYHREVMDIVLWRTLPRELVESVCAFLPFSKAIQLTKSWSRLPMTTTFRRFCAEAHSDLFGIFMNHEDSGSYRLAVSNSHHTKWYHMGLSIPYNYEARDYGNCEELFGHGGGLICILPSSFDYFEEPPSILVYNPLTDDNNSIQLSDITIKTWVEANNIEISDSTRKTGIEAILLQLIMDEERRCYKLILLTRSAEPRGEEVLQSEIYDSKSGLWSSLESGFLYGEGVVGGQRSHIFFDCTSKRFCKSDGKPPTEGLLVVNPNFQLDEDELDDDDPSKLCFVAFVRNHGSKKNCIELEGVRNLRIKMKFIDVEGDDRMYRLLEMSESVWQNGWEESFTTIFYEMEEPPESFETRLLACQRYLLVVADDTSCDTLMHRHQRMVLYDRETGREAYDVPQFLTKDFVRDTNFMCRNLLFMCDLKWDAIP